VQRASVPQGCSSQSQEHRLEIGVTRARRVDQALDLVQDQDPAVIEDGDWLGGKRARSIKTRDPRLKLAETWSELDEVLRARRASRPA
jgi:hypothetical protein